MTEINSQLPLPPDTRSDEWQGGIRHQFDFNGHNAWIVEPPSPLPGKKWFWLPEWPTAFPSRNGVNELLQFGCYMIHVNVFGLFANQDAVKIMKEFHDHLVSMGFENKGAFIGMSLGGLYSFRYARHFPEDVACIYADAPVCDLNYRKNTDRTDKKDLQIAYNCSAGELENHPLSPVNDFQTAVKAGIPLLMILGLSDNSVNAESNGLLLAERWKNAGGNVELITRNFWGHHPHGLDNPLKIVRFILENTLNK